MRKISFYAILLASALPAAGQELEALKATAAQVASHQRAIKTLATEYLEKSKTEISEDESREDLIRRLALRQVKEKDVFSRVFGGKKPLPQKDATALEEAIAKNDIEEMSKVVSLDLRRSKEAIIMKTIDWLSKIGDANRPPVYTTKTSIVDGKLVTEKVEDRGHEVREIAKQTTAYSRAVYYLEKVSANKPNAGDGK